MLWGIRDPLRRGATWATVAAYFAFSVTACSSFDDDGPPPAPTDATWSKSFGDPLPQDASAVVVDAFGNVYVAGSFEGTADFGGGPRTAAGGADVFIAKYDTNGVHVWSSRYGDAGPQRATAIALDANGNIVVVGSFGGAIEFAGQFLSAVDANDGFLLKLDPDGNQLLGRALPGTMQERPLAVAVDAASGAFVIGGDFNADMDFGGGAMLTTSGERDVFVVKLDQSGNHLWSQRYGHALGDDFLSALDVDPRGYVAITGRTPGEIDFGGGPLLPIGANSNDDAYVAVLSADGSHVWSRRLGDDQAQRGNDVSFLSNGELLTCGSFSGTINFGSEERTSTGSFDVYVAKFSAVGDVIWSRGYGVSDEQQGYRVVAERQGNVLLAGDFRGEVTFGGGQLSSAGEYDIYIAKLDASGNHVASLRFGDELAQHVGDLAADGAGNAILVGGYFGSIDFGFGQHQSAGDEDPFVAKLTLDP